MRVLLAYPNRTFVSGGINPNAFPTCTFPKRCAHLIADPSHSGGWCAHSANRVPPSEGWPSGFTPSVAPDGGCVHNSNEGGAFVPSSYVVPEVDRG